MQNNVNPFTSALALENSNYLLMDEENKLLSKSRKTPFQDDEKIFRTLQGLIEEDSFPCLAAKASLNTRSYRMGIYAHLADEELSHGLANDLIRFLHDRSAHENGFATFIAAFKAPAPETEEEFEALLWKQLRILKALSTSYFEWDPGVASDPKEKNFGFSFGGKAFFVIGMHSRSSRLARRSPLPLLVFNLHDQFKALRQIGKFEGLKEAIRQRDKNLQGFINPMLSDFGEVSEARQYAGRAVSENWKCPFH